MNNLRETRRELNGRSLVLGLKHFKYKLVILLKFSAKVSCKPFFFTVNGSLFKRKLNSVKIVFTEWSGLEVSLKRLGRFVGGKNGPKYIDENPEAGGILHKKEAGWDTGSQGERINWAFILLVGETAFFMYIFFSINVFGEIGWYFAFQIQILKCGGKKIKSFYLIKLKKEYGKKEIERASLKK